MTDDNMIPRLPERIWVHEQWSPEGDGDTAYVRADVARSEALAMVAAACKCVVDQAVGLADGLDEAAFIEDRVTDAIPADALAALEAVKQEARQEEREKIAEERRLVEYVLQDDLHNRLTPRVVDIAYSAFMAAKQSNSEDGGPSDWFTDTKPMVDQAIGKIVADIAAIRATDTQEEKE